MATINSSFGEVTYPALVGTNQCEVIANLWEKNGKSRVYFKVKMSNGEKVDCGYFDNETGTSCISSRPVSWGQKINEAVSIASLKTPQTAKDAAKTNYKWINGMKIYETGNYGMDVLSGYYEE